MATINKNWHHKHKLALNSSLETRIAWHLEHQKQCACRSMPAWMVKKLKASKEKS